MPLILVDQRKLRLEVSEGQNLMRALLDAGLPVASSCQGDGVCAKCKLRVTVASTGEAMARPLTSDEERHRQMGNLPEGLRLSCQITVEEDLRVEAFYW